MKNKQRNKILVILLVIILPIVLIINLKDSNKMVEINRIGGEVNLGYEKGVEIIQGEVGAGSVSVDNTKEYMINNHIQVIKGKGPILLYNQEDNDFKIKAKLELIKEVMISETDKKQEVVMVIETEEVSPGYYIENIEVRGLNKGYYPTKVEIIKVMEDGTEETLDKMGLMIEIRN